MSRQITLRPAAAPELTSALDALMAEPEEVVSDATLYSPQAVGALLLGLLASPKVPEEPKGK
ncbi:hypothetical protein [Saccharothrix obliqua]|uniref:hypothetical protein n=1 Tax=Saccharothrix obliqua TaxID=2861747 RepID=UPI001C5FD87B|nr:hypothetical protein [Saccharothrix obliqua]MBW4716429.1 hypothetical protein [Saccharothrix obliqua]